MTPGFISEEFYHKQGLLPRQQERGANGKAQQQT